MEEHQIQSGKANGLFLLIDSSPFRLTRPDNKKAEFDIRDQSFKMTIHTLAPFTTFRPGSFKMNALKKMTGTSSFEKLPDKQKKCSVRIRAECQTQKYLAAVRKHCNCTLWALAASNAKHQVSSFNTFDVAGVHILWPREGKLCSNTDCE